MSIFAISCNDKEEENTTPAAVANAEKVEGTYEGYTLASCNYFSNNFTADESLTITKTADNTVDVSFTSGTWGTTTITSATVTTNGSGYSVTGEGECSMRGNSYPCTLTADVASTSNATLTFSVPAVMGGTTIVFKTGKASTGYYVAGSYRGDIDVSVSGTSYITIADTVMTLKAEEGDKASIVTPLMEMSMGPSTYSVPATTFENISVTTSDYENFTIGESPVTFTVGSSSWTGTVSGTMTSAGALTLAFSVTPGAMPMPITITFTHTPSK